jgi:hypothetical protein
MFQQMRIAIGDSLSDIASFDDGEDVVDYNGQETEQGKLSGDDEPGWVMKKRFRTVEQWI